METDQPPQNNGADSNQPVRSRASQACSGCRSRKVKCDLLKFGAPCHNCKVDGLECVVPESRRSRKFRLRKRQQQVVGGAPNLGLSDVRPRLATTILHEEDGAHMFTTFPAQMARRSSYPSNSSTSPKPTQLPPNSNPNPHEPTRSLASTTALASPSSIYQAAPLLEVAKTKNTVSHPIIPTANQPIIYPPTVKTSEATLPPYIAPPQREISQSDLEFLVKRGALSIPETDVRDQLLRCFVLYIYPHQPVVCLEDFLHAIEVDGRDGTKISLSLFQAVMFAGTAFVDEQFLQQAGFDTRRQAREYFYNKVKLLYDFDWEADRIVLMQTILLHAYWYISENDQKDPWHWLGVCISLGTSLGLNDIHTYTNKDQKSRKLWRRLWWCGYIRDRIMAISTRKPMRFSDDHMQIPMLSLDDFDLQDTASNITPIQEAFSVMNPAGKIALAEFCMAKVKLLSIMGRILERLYRLQAFSGATTGRRMLYGPRPPSEMRTGEVNRLIDRLEKWNDQLPDTCQLRGDEEQHGDREPTFRYQYIFRIYLKMLYLLTVDSLYRPSALSPRSRSSLSTDELHHVAQSISRDSALQMAGLSQSLQEQDILRFLPPISIFCLSNAIMGFLSEVRSSGKSMTELHGGKLQHCIRGLWRLRDAWHIADHACHLTGRVIRASQQIVRARSMTAGPSPLSPISQGDTRDIQPPPLGGSPAREQTPRLGVARSPSRVAPQDGGGLTIPEFGSPFADFGFDLGLSLTPFSWPAADLGFTDGMLFSNGGNMRASVAPGSSSGDHGTKLASYGNNPVDASPFGVFGDTEEYVGFDGPFWGLAPRVT